MRLLCSPVAVVRALILATALVALATAAPQAPAAPLTAALRSSAAPTLPGSLRSASLPPPTAVASSAGPCAYAPIAGDTSVSLSSGGRTRDAVLHMPPSAPGRALPLIVAFGHDGQNFARDSGLSALADRDGFAVVYPSSLGAGWEISGSERDVIFASDLLDRVESQACIAYQQIYATGVSNGAGMAARVGCELSARIAALVLVAGGYRALPACRPDRPLSVLEIHGTKDRSVPYHGQGPGHDGGVLLYIKGWATRDRCNPTPTKHVIAAHTVRYRWSGCASGAVVEHLRVYGSGHGLPNAAGPELSSGRRSPISGARNIWHFLGGRVLGQPFAT